MICFEDYLPKTGGYFDYCDCGSGYGYFNCCDYCETEFNPLLHKIIVIDPGHGGIYTGAQHFGIREADVNLAVALKLRKKLRQSGAKIVMTRRGDYNLVPAGASLRADLQARVNVAQRTHADIFVSLHSDSSSDPKESGAASYYPANGSSDLARSIQTSLVKETCAKDNGIKAANFYVLIHNDIPASLIEMGFLSNRKEADCLTNDAYQKLLAEGIYQGIFNFFESMETAPDEYCSPQHFTW